MNNQTIMTRMEDPIIQVKFSSQMDPILSAMFLKNVVGTTGYITDKETEHYNCKSCMVFERDHGASESVVYEIELTGFDSSNPNVEWVRLCDCLDKCTNWAVREGYMHDSMCKRITRLVSRDANLKDLANIVVDMYPVDIAISIIGKDGSELWRPLLE